MESYEELLNEAYEKVKPVSVSSYAERFEIPKANAQVIGNKTIISNFLQICSYLRRDCLHLAKFLSRELAAFSKIENERLVLNRKIQSQQINDKIIFYVEEFVMCRECKKPDTELIKQGEFLFLHCLACGAKHSVRAKI
ncbi:translation initiation factor IF-2 subunit beta [Candidatus Pacearchaeota archaeon]|nr:translation initiation factor IF-2 subunit beta [Candidatus Pacearchaeota archaeon]